MDGNRKKLDIVKFNLRMYIFCVDHCLQCNRCFHFYSCGKYFTNDYFHHDAFLALGRMEIFFHTFHSKSCALRDSVCPVSTFR